MKKIIKFLIIFLVIILILLLCILLFALKKNKIEDNYDKIETVDKDDNNNDSKDIFEIEDTDEGNGDIYSEEEMYIAVGKIVNLNIINYPEELKKYISMEDIEKNIKMFVFEHGIPNEATEAKYVDYYFKDEENTLMVMFSLNDEKSTYAIISRNLSNNDIFVYKTQYDLFYIYK